MKSVKILAVAVAVAAATLWSVPRAQAGSVVLRAEIPFEFVVGEQRLPSGEYRIVQDPWRVRIYSKDGAQVAVVHWLPQTTSGNGSWKLVFHTYGSQRFLRLIADRGGKAAAML